MAEPSHAVFLSYASQDAEAAQRICEALRSVGVRVFIDQRELRGGDAWDQKIRHEIHDCALFIPIISQHTQERLEGYFRHEWNLAIERTHRMAQQKPFLVPVVVDGTRNQEALVPDAFRAVQWMRLPGGDTPPAFAERIKRLLSPEVSPMNAPSGAAPIGKRVPASWRSNPVLLAAIAVLVAVSYFVADKFWVSEHIAAPPRVTSASPATSAPANPAAFSPPPHSIAVLPFVNISGDASQEYFSDGMTEELLNSLSRINELQVAGRTSSFYFKGKDVDLGTIARKLNVATVLEGSVRRSGHTVRITTQLINGVTGFHLWSQTYDRNLADILALQTQIANAVASALKVTLLADVAAKVEVGGTRNPGAYDAFLRGLKVSARQNGEKDLQDAIAEWTEAIRRDPHYALAFAARSQALRWYTSVFVTGPASREGWEKVQADARKAIALAPDLAEGHRALAGFLADGSHDFARANEEYERALALAPGSVPTLRDYGLFAVWMGRTEAGLAAARHAVLLDPLNRNSHHSLGWALIYARHYREAIAAFQETAALDPDFDPFAGRGFAYYALGNYQKARASCESLTNYAGQMCLAVTYDKLGRHADAESMVARWKASRGDADAYQYAEVYTQWGNAAKALDWLDTAVHLHDPGLEYLKADPLLDPLRKEPRFQAIERALKFPE